MITTKRLSDPPAVPYTVKYGPRSGLRTAKLETSVVDHSFLRPREELDLSKLQDLTPEWVEAMKQQVYRR